MQNACPAMTTSRLHSLGLSRVMKKLAVKVSANFCLPTRFVGVIGASRSLAVFAIVVEATNKKRWPSIATSDSRRFRTARSDCSCLRPKRRRQLLARYRGNPRLCLDAHSGKGVSASLSHLCRHAQQHYGQSHIDGAYGRQYERRPNRRRSGSPPSPPPRLIRPVVGLLPRSPRFRVRVPITRHIETDTATAV